MGIVRPYMAANKNKVALITGASGGIGYEPALICAKSKAGYQAMMKGKLYVIPGVMNKLLALSTRIMPSRSAVLALSALFSKEQK